MWDLLLPRPLLSPGTECADSDLCNMTGGRLLDLRCRLLPRPLLSPGTEWVGVDSVEGAGSMWLVQVWTVTNPAPRPSGLADSSRSRNRSEHIKFSKIQFSPQCVSIFVPAIQTQRSDLSSTIRNGISMNPGEWIWRSDCQCKCCNYPDLDPSIWVTANETVLNKVRRNKANSAVRYGVAP